MRRILPFALALALLVPAAAQASSDALIADCTKDSRLDKTYSQKEYKDALNDLGGDADEYTNCRDIISRAQQTAARKSAAGTSGSGGSQQGSGDGSSSGAAPTGGGDGGGGQTGSGAVPDPVRDAPPAPGEQQALDQTRASLDDSVLSAARAAAAPGVDSDADIPTSVVVLLIALGLGAAAFGAQRVSSLVRSHRSA